MTLACLACSSRKNRQSARSFSARNRGCPSRHEPFSPPPRSREISAHCHWNCAWKALEIFPPATFFQRLDDFADRFFLILVGHKRRIGSVNDDGVIDTERNDEMFGTAADDRTRCANPQMLADYRISRFIRADRAGK